MEDLSNMLVIPNMSVAVPCDEEQTYKMCIYAATEHKGPFYFRMCREKSSCITDSDTPFDFGKALLLEEGGDLTFIACGVILDRVLWAADLLKEQGLTCRVLNMHTLKPLDTEAIDRAVEDTGCVVTAEEHSRYGGLGSLVAMHLGKHHTGRASFDMVAIEDRYMESGPPGDMLDLAGLTPDNIASVAHSAWSRKPD
jgi:transketolase